MDNSQPTSPELPLTILLAEDNEMNQFLITSVLSDWGMYTQIAENGKEAVELLSKESFDLVLMDMQMPVMNGYEAIQKIRAMELPKANIPIILLSASDSESEIDKCLAVGADAHVNKPFNAHELYEVIQRLIPSNTPE